VKKFPHCHDVCRDAGEHTYITALCAMNPPTYAHTTCPWCQHTAHRPGTECFAGVNHDPKHWHRCLCLNLVGADRTCPEQMTCQGGTLSYSDLWYAQQYPNRNAQ
jgi:hypothetical protein